MKKFMLLLAVSASLHAFSQDSSNVHMAVKVNLATPFDVFYFPTFDLSLEHRIGRRFSISGEAGYQLYRFGSPDTVFIKSGGHKLKGEVRFYQPFATRRNGRLLKTPMTGFYTGFNVFYRAEKYNSAVMYTQKNDSTTVTDYYWTEKSAVGVNLLFGYQEVYWRRLVIDAYAGIGLLERKIAHHEKEFDAEDGDTQVACTDLDCFFSARDLSEHSGQGLSLAVGFRIGYIIY